jgi:ABC-type uncharacterized transport system involved in gliding motility auxiliary subunit
MDREVRRSTRTVVGLLHMLIQALIVGRIIQLGLAIRETGRKADLNDIQQMLFYIALTMAIFAIQSSAIKLLTRHSSQQHH